MIQPNSAPQPDGSMQPNSSLVPVQTDVTAEYYLKIGKTLYQGYLARSQKQDLDNAIKHFQKAVELEPNLAEAYVQLASALWEQGTINLELAQFYCETALKLDPNQAEANLFLGYFLQRAGFFEDAVQQYAMAIRKDLKRSARPRIALGNVLLKQALEVENKRQQVSLAFKGTTQFLAGCAFLPFDKQMCVLLKEALLSDAQIYAVEGLAKGFNKLGFKGVSRKIYQFGAHMMPKEPLFYHLLGDACLFDLDEPDKAVEYYKQAQVLEPDNLSLLKKLGKAYTKANDNINAVAIYDHAVEMDGDDFDSLYQLAQLHMDQKSYFKALYFFKESEILRPHNPYVHSNMAYILFKMDDMEGAFEEYKKALDFGTDPIWLSTVAQTVGTISYQIYKNMAEALDYFQQSLQYNPKNVETMAVLADLYFETGQLEMALSAYKSILNLESENADCYSNIGYILWQLDRNDAAIDAYLTALRYDSKNHISYNNLGVIYLDEDYNPAKALPLFETALNLKPDYTLACFNIGRALESLNKPLEAAERYSEALVLNKLNTELEDDEIQDRIDRLFD